MDGWQYLSDSLSFVVDDILHIFLPTSVALTALYVPIFLLALCSRSIFRIPKWLLTVSLLLYLLFLPTCPLIRSVPVFNTCVAGMAIYYAQKVCEWILVRQNEFQQWSFWDVHHELFYYRLYTQPVKLTKLNRKSKEIFFSGPIQFDKHAYSLICISANIIKYYFLLDATIYLMNEAFSTTFYENYYRKYLLVRILVDQLGGCVLYCFFMLNYEMLRHALCFLLNRPLELIPDLFRQPYQATSPVDFWSRWHQIFKSTWIELIFKPVSTYLRQQYPSLPQPIIYVMSAMCVFIFSGIVHEYPVYIAWNEFSGSQIIFFLWQGLAVIAEHGLRYQFPKLHIPKPLGWFLTFAFNGITAGYFIQPWIPYFNRRHTFKYSLINFITGYLFGQY